jgi:hypothetical protein
MEVILAKIVSYYNKSKVPIVIRYNALHVRLVAAPSASPANTQFSHALNEICRRLLSEGPNRNQAAIAKSLGLDPPRLSRILANQIPVGARTVAIICSRLDRVSAASVLQAYLTDEIRKVRRVQKELGLNTEWGEQDLVKIVRTEV